MKRSLCLALLCLLCSVALPLAAEQPSVAPVVVELAPSCSAPVSTAASAKVSPTLADFLVPEPTQAASCTVSVLCRCGQRLSCTSLNGNCQKVNGCSVTCDGNEQVCPPCNGFGCA
jgi:hypothetical protein